MPLTHIHRKGNQNLLTITGWTSRPLLRPPHAGAPRCAPSLQLHARGSVTRLLWLRAPAVSPDVVRGPCCTSPAPVPGTPPRPPPKETSSSRRHRKTASSSGCIITRAIRLVEREGTIQATKSQTSRDWVCRKWPWCTYMHLCMDFCWPRTMLWVAGKSGTLQASRRRLTSSIGTRHSRPDRMSLWVIGTAAEMGGRARCIFWGTYLDGTVAACYLWKWEIQDWFLLERE